MKKLTIFLLFTFFLQALSAQTIKYVKPASSGSGDGSSWANASSDLQAMINTKGVKQIWIAGGTYYPTKDINGATPSDNREKTFVLRDSIALYGGFSGATTDTSLKQRNWYADSNITKLSGDIGVAGKDSDNCYHVLYLSINKLSANVLLDGLHITGGNANAGNGLKAAGGALWVNYSAIGFNNCKIYSNSAKDGGAIYNQNSNVWLTNSIVSGNYASATGGAISNYGTPGYFLVIVYNNVGTLNMVNCLVSGNRSDAAGGAIYSKSTDIALTNCTIASNSVATQGAFLDNNGSINALGNMVSIFPEIRNCLIWGNTCDISTTSLIANNNAYPNITYSLLQSGYPGYGYSGNGSINADPMFVSPLSSGLNAGGDYRLKSCSPAIDLANEGLNGSTKDLAGNQRNLNACDNSRNSRPALNMDMGAYEYPKAWPYNYYDGDNDGYGSASYTRQQCEPEPGFVGNSDDCNDGSAIEKPGQVWHADKDGDGYSSPTDTITIVQCSRPGKYKALVELKGFRNDCDDTVATANPGTNEICGNGIDDNCDGVIDFGPYPNPKITAPNGLALCLRDSVLISSNFTQRILWNTGDTTKNIQVKKTGKYFFSTVTGSASGCRKYSDTVVVYQKSEYGFNQNYIQYICPGVTNSMNIDTVAGNKYQWSPASGLSNSNVARPVVTATQNKTYFLTETTPQGCILKDSIRVVMAGNPSPKPTITVTPNSCGTTAILKVSPADTLDRISWLMNGSTAQQGSIRSRKIAPFNSEPFVPWGIHVAKNGDVFVANFGGNQVEKWTPGAKFPVIVAGGNGAGTALNQVRPTDVFVDDSGNLFVAEFSRITKWKPGAKAGIIVAGAKPGSLASCYGFDMDKAGNIYAASRIYRNVTKWKPGDTVGTVVAGGNGSGSALNQMDPHKIILDEFDNIYVADFSNYRVTKWAPGATQGVVVAGGNGEGTAPNQIAGPLAIDVDAYGNLFVADIFNLVTKWAPGSPTGDLVAGYGTGYFDDLSLPRGIKVKEDGTMYLAEYSGKKVTKGGYRNSTQYQANYSGSYKAMVYNAQGCSVSSDSVNISVNNIYSPGNAIHFDGVDDHLSVSSRINCPAEFTLEAWFKTDSAKGPIIGFNSDSAGFVSAGGWDKFIYMEPTGQLVFGVFTSVINTITSPSAYNDGRYHHVAATCSQNTGIKLYVDGELVAKIDTLKGGNIITYSGFWRIGGLRNWSSNGALAFHGAIDEVRIWNGPRNAGKIKEDRFKIIAPNSAGLSHYYRMNEGSASGDNSGITYTKDQTCNAQASLHNFKSSGDTSNWVESYAMVVPRVLSATDITRHGFQSNWQPSVLGSADHYLFDLATDKGFTSFVPGYNGKTVNATSVKVSGLSAGIPYYYRVRSNKTSLALQGGFSDLIGATTLPCRGADSFWIPVANPAIQTVNVNATVRFVAFSNDPDAAFQWQTNNGSGFMNMANTGQYSGVNSDTLTISNVSLTNSNQIFRCIASSGTCLDTSKTVLLRVNDNLGSPGINNTGFMVTLFPNPVQNTLNIRAESALIGSTYAIYDNTGRIVMSGKIGKENTVISTAELSAGMYWFSTGGNNGQTLKLLKTME